MRNHLHRLYTNSYLFQSVIRSTTHRHRYEQWLLYNRSFFAIILRTTITTVSLNRNHPALFNLKSFYTTSTRVFCIFGDESERESNSDPEIGIQPGTYNVFSSYQTVISHCMEKLLIVICSICKLCKSKILFNLLTRKIEYWILVFNIKYTSKLFHSWKKHNYFFNRIRVL